MGEENLSCGSQCMKGLLLILNVLFVIIGLALIGIGIYIRVDSNFASILSSLSTEGRLEVKMIGFLAFVMIGGGIFTLLIALLGCMGALWQNRCFLYMYAVILIILMILELVGFILALVYKGKLKDYFEEPLLDVLENALKNSNATESKEILDGFQSLENAMACCGAHNKSDYDRYLPRNLSSSCVKGNTKGCAEAIIDWFSKNLPVVGGSLGAMLVVELFGLISACVLASAVKNSPDRYSTPSWSDFRLLGRKS